jgi:hypothetical protein
MNPRNARTALAVLLSALSFVALGLPRGVSAQEAQDVQNAQQAALAPTAPAPAATQGVELVDGSLVPGKVLASVPGAYVILERENGTKEAVEWARVSKIDGQPPPPIPTLGPGTLIPQGFEPERVSKLGEAGKRFSELAPGLVAPADGQTMIGSIRGTQDLLEQVGLKRGPPNIALATAPLFMMPFCFEARHGTIGRFDGTGGLGAGCKYVLLPLSVAQLVLAPFIGSEKVKEIDGPTVHHLDTSVYALDYSKKSALTGSFAREPQGGFLGNNLGYDLTYTYIHPRYGVVGYGHLTLQQTSIADTNYLDISSSFFKSDAQVGLDVIRLLSGGKKGSYWTQHTAYFRAGPSMFHSWVTSRDVGSSKAGAAVDNPLNNSVPLVTGLGYELAAELDFRFPYWLGGVHFKFERGTYPSLSFAQLDPRDSAFVALIGFDDLRTGSSYTWQRLKLELELPINYSRAGGISLGGQIAKYENNFGSGVDNRGISLDYRLRFQ